MQTKFDKSYYFGDVYDNYDQFLDFGKLATELIVSYEFDSFLDIGCGCGNLVKEIKKQLESKCKKDCDVRGIDISDFAVKRADASFIHLADCTVLPFKDNQFDMVYILGTFAYLETEKALLKAMREAYRVSRKGIVFEDVYTVPDKKSDDYDPHRVQFRNQEDWSNLWKKILNKNDKVKFNKDEIFITKYEP